MTAELGLFFLILALMVALLQAAFLLPLHTVKQAVSPCLIPAAWLQALCVTTAFALLMILRIDSDFSVVTVAANSNLALPLLYKIAGTWGNHEGSMLLWVWVLAVFGAALAFTGNPLPLKGGGPGWGSGRMLHHSGLPPLPFPFQGEGEVRMLATSVQSLLCAGFLLFILTTSNPFARQFPPPADGDALNPILQDMALSIHPPLLYLGYVGFSLVFSLAVAALIEGKMTREWARIAHPWILASWSALTVGIGLGSWWAYRVLGWGGFWFWDPVENASLMPWLCGTALLHSNIVLKKRGHLQQWVLLLAIITFVMSMLGTFLVRSGLLTSVHSFASDPARGLFILGLIALSAGGALLLYAIRAGGIAGEEEEDMQPVSREGLVVVNNMCLLTGCATVLLGTLYPMLMEWWQGDRITVGAPYFNSILLPILGVPLVFAGLAPFMPWAKGDWRRALKRARPALMAAVAAAAIVIYATHADAATGAAGIALCVWLAAASAQWLRGERKAWPVFLGHMGAALVIAGVTGAGVWKQEAERAVAVGDAIDIAGYHLVYEMQAFEDTGDYHAKIGRFRIADTHEGYIGTLAPEYRIFAIRKTATSTAAIHSTLFYDLYAVIGETSEDGRRTAARIYYNPLVNLIWLGCLTMAAGGFAAWIRRKA